MRAAYLLSLQGLLHAIRSCPICCLHLNASPAACHAAQVTIFQALTHTAPDNVLAVYAAITEQSSSVAESLPRWQLIAVGGGGGRRWACCFRRLPR